MRMQENGSLLIWDKLKDLIDAEIAEKTASCVRMKTMVVTTAYDETTKTVGVTEAFGEEVQLPVCGDIDGTALAVGQSVWVMIPYSMSNAIVTMRGDGFKPNTAQNLSMSTSDATSVYEAILSKASARATTATLSTNGWVLTNGVYTQTAAVSGVTQDNTVQVSPAPESYEAYCEALVRATAQAADSLTFTANEQPTVNLTVNVLIVEVTTA